MSLAATSTELRQINDKSQTGKRCELQSKSLENVSSFSPMEKITIITNLGKVRTVTHVVNLSLSSFIIISKVQIIRLTLAKRNEIADDFHQGWKLLFCKCCPELIMKPRQSDSGHSLSSVCPSRA